MNRLVSILFLIVSFYTLFPQSVFAQDQKADPRGSSSWKQPDDTFFSLLKQVLDVNIAARVSEAGEKAIWTVESSELTIPGRSVNVKLVGKNILVVASFTPYLKESGEIILVAQGQVWISSPVAEEIKYLTTLKNIPITLGEKVLFFPLGVRNLEQEGKNLYNIELEIRVLPFSRPPEQKSK
ncbi:MAG: hypothetical protein N2442_02540 [Spirochaetes bacterium]|nr:hypothetical protein [Spirochaetota bacterium]